MSDRRRVRASSANGVTRTTALGADRMAREPADALPDGDGPLRAAVRTPMRPLLSPRLAALHTDGFVTDDETNTTVDLAAHRGDSTLDDLDLGDTPAAASAERPPPLRALTSA
jgi:hypothetical protein